MLYWREIDRGGQVYYLYNKVDWFEKKVSELQELIPEILLLVLFMVK